jgi:hypothetical protein
MILDDLLPQNALGEDSSCQHAESLVAEYVSGKTSGKNFV